MASNTAAQARNPILRATNTLPPVPESEPPRWNRSAPYRASFTGRSTSESDRYRGESQQVARAAIRPLGPERPEHAMEDPAEGPVPGRAVDPAEEKCPDRDEQAVEIVVVHQMRGPRGRKNTPIPASQRISRTGSERSPAASGESSRSAANTGRGACGNRRTPDPPVAHGASLASNSDGTPAIAAGAGLGPAEANPTLELARQRRGSWGKHGSPCQPWFSRGYAGA